MKSTALGTDVPESRIDAPREPWYRVASWKLRNKIILALAFPMVTATWFAVDNAVEATSLQRDQEATAGQLSVLDPALDFLYAAQTATVVARQEGGVDNPRAQQAISDVEQAAERLDGLADHESLTDNQKAQITNLVALSDQMSDGRAYTSVLQSVSQVSQLHNAVTDFFQVMTTSQTTQEPAINQIAYIMEGRLAFVKQQLQVEFRGNSNLITNQPQVYSSLGAEDIALSALARNRADDPTLMTLRNLNTQRMDIVAAGQGEMPYAETLTAYDQMNRQVVDDSAARLDARSTDARNTALLTIAILVGALITTLVLALMIVRTIVGPVRRVRDGAIAVASEELPRAVAQIRAGAQPDPVQPIGVHTQEEMGQLARAVDDLHRTAVDLAAGEAELRSQVGEMFVTLSRRNTSLINQQLGLIEELEHDEQDPRRLESLFRLDHLAARMRRTAESLVILSDAPTRQREGQPLAVTDALQAATAGVEDYQRIQLRGASPDQLVGSAANDVVHLLTELMDNALRFSPPHSAVQVSTTSASAQTIITIADSGLGIPGDVLDQLNSMLSTDVGITPDAARRMGLFVVSRLAHRHGIRVTLSQNEGGGITATVIVPSGLLLGGVATPSELPVDDRPEIAPPTLVPSPAPEPRVFEYAPPVEPPVATPDPVAAAAPSTPAVNPLTGLPQRRPGATVSDREAAVKPAGGGLFAPADDAPAAGGLFDRAEPAPAPAVPDNPVAPAAAEVPAAAEPEVEATPDPLNDPLNDPLPGSFTPYTEQPVEPSLPPVVETTPVAAVETVVEEPVLTPAAEMPPPQGLAPLPTRSAPVPEEPVTPMTSEASASISMFGAPPRDESAIARNRDRELDPAVSARVGLFGAFSKGARDRGEESVAAGDAPTSAKPVLGGSSALDGPSVLERRAAETRAREERAARAAKAKAAQTAPAPAPSADPQSPASPVDPAGTVTYLRESATTTASDASAAAAPSGHGTVTQIGSRWLGGEASDSWAQQEVDKGWAAAQQVATRTTDTPTTGAGLPKRRPGQRLVPGGISPTAATPPRDPEAVRKRLAAHAAGVSRGRSATVQSPSRNKKEEGQ